MIVKYNVCDNCGTQKEIKEDIESGVGVAFEIASPEKVVTSSLFRNDVHIVTFCDRECLLSYLKEHLNPNGFMRENND